MIPLSPQFSGRTKWPRGEWKGEKVWGRTELTSGWRQGVKKEEKGKARERSRMEGRTVDRGKQATDTKNSSASLKRYPNMWHIIYTIFLEFKNGCETHFLPPGVGGGVRMGVVCLSLPGFRCLEPRTVYRVPGGLPKGPQGSLLPIPGWGLSLYRWHGGSGERWLGLYQREKVAKSPALSTITIPCRLLEPTPKN